MMRHAVRICMLCGRQLSEQLSGRRRRYCSRACRQRAYRIREHERLWRESDPDPDDVGDVRALLDAALRAARS